MFCPACAAPLEPGVTACSKCGEPVRTTPVPAAGRSDKPPSVGLAGKLLWLTVVMGLFSTAYLVLRYGASIAWSLDFVLFYFLEMAAWIAAVVLTLRRNNMARLVLFGLVVFAILNTLRNSLMHPFQIDLEYGLWLVEIGVRLGACYLLLRPESNAWFRAETGAVSAPGRYN